MAYRDTQDSLRAIYAIAVAQGGYFTAKQAAEAGLRHCEAAVLNNATPIVIQATNSNTWKTFSKWQDGVSALTVPAAALQSNDGSILAPTTHPQCMAERSPAGNEVYIITARGFSPDFQADNTGATKSGSVVWLQSVVAYAN